METPVAFLKDETKFGVNFPCPIANEKHNRQQNKSNNEKTTFADTWEVAFFNIAADEVIIILEIGLQASLDLFFFFFFLFIFGFVDGAFISLWHL
jgi:hypothetical protein